MKSEETISMKTKRADFVAAIVRGRMVVAGGLGMFPENTPPIIMTADSSTALSLCIVLVTCLLTCRSSALSAGYRRGFPS